MSTCIHRSPQVSETHRQTTHYRVLEICDLVARTNRHSGTVVTGIFTVLLLCYLKIQQQESLIHNSPLHHSLSLQASQRQALSIYKPTEPMLSYRVYWKRKATSELRHKVSAK